MKKAFAALLVLICLLAAIWFAGADAWFLDVEQSSERVAISRMEDDAATIRTKKFRSKERIVEKTHRPEQLVRFYLPQLEIDGITLTAALEKLRAAYVDACLKSGEKPLQFVFDVRDEDNNRIIMKLSGMTFSGSVKLLAAAAGMNVKRSELVYVFERFPDHDVATKQTVEESNNVKQRLGEMAGLTEGEYGSMKLRDLIGLLGISLDPSTKLTSTADGKIVIESEGDADAAKLSALLGQVGSEQEVQVKATSKILQLLPGSEWDARGMERLSEQETELFMRDMAQKAGTDLMTMPVVMTRNFTQDAKIEMIKEVILPVEGHDDQFKSYEVGKVVSLKAGALGFGQTVSATYTDTEFDPEASGDARIRERTKLQTDGFADDGGARITVQERPDGSKVIMLMTGELIDPTGRPIRRGGN